MKKSSTLLIAAALILSSCGTTAQYAQSGSEQQFQDGIYNNTPAFRTRGEKEQAKTETQALVEKTKESPIYLFGDRKDTVMIPQDMSAMIRYDQKLGGTVVTVGENPYDWRYDLENNYGYYYPYSINYSWRFSPWYGSSWHVGGWYSPWYRNSWYYSGWYDPWYYGGWYGWYDPWYYGSYWHGHHYCGWYGGWDPYWGYHYGHGPGYGRPYERKEYVHVSRLDGGSGRAQSGRVSVRNGGGGSQRSLSLRTGDSGRLSVKGTAAAGRPTAARPAGSSIKKSDRLSISKSSAVRVTPDTRPASTKPVSVTRPATATRPINHRKPTSISGISGKAEYNGSIKTSGSVKTNSSIKINSSSSSRPSSYERNSSDYNRSSSGYRSSSSSSSNRSSYSSGSSRSSYGGGGYSRGGASSSRRR